MSLLNTKILKKIFLKFFITVCFFALLNSIFTLIFKNVYIQEYDIDLPAEFSKPIKILHISDFHSNDFGDGQTKIIKKINASNPDMIFITGDLFDFYTKKDKPVENVRLLLEGIKNLAPIYYVSGNHEFYNFHKDEFNYLITQNSGTVLKDMTVKFTIEEKTLLISGIDDPFADFTQKEKTKERKKNRTSLRYIERLNTLNDNTMQIENQLKTQGEEVLCKMLLTHRPEYAKAYSKTGYDIIFAGHSHGGQWRLPGIKNGLYCTDEGLFPKYSGGTFILPQNNAVMIVSRGLSWQRPKIARLFNRPELVLVNIY